MKFYEHRMEKIKAVFNWSGEKDSAHALWRARQSELYDIVALLTTINRDSQRSTMHGIPLPLLQAQADSIGIPLHIVNLTPQGNLENYAEAMTCAALHFKEQGVTHFIFGDIYLHDVRAYRERQLAPLGIEVVEPLWGVVSSEIVMQQYLASGLKTVIVTTQADGLGMDAIGREVDADLLPLSPRKWITTEKTENTTRSATTDRYSPHPYFSDWELPLAKVMTSGLRMARFKPILIVLPIFPPNHNTDYICNHKSTIWKTKDIYMSILATGKERQRPHLGLPFEFCVPEEASSSDNS